MDAAGEVAQVLERQSGFLAGAAHQLGRHRVALGSPLLRHPQVQRQRDQALLGAVVEVALDPPALGVGGLDDARAGAAQVGHLGGHAGSTFDPSSTSA